MKRASDLALDCGYLKNIIAAAAFIDNENAGSNDRKLNEMLICLLHVAERLSGELHDGLDELAG